MGLVRTARIGLLLGILPLVTGCASLSPKFNLLPSVARHRAASQFETAQRAEQQGQWTKAKELYAALQRSSPQTPLYAHRMGVVCIHLGDYSSGEKYLQHARSLDPANSGIIADLGYLAYLQKDFPGAEALLTDAVRLKPGEPRAVNNLAMAIGFQGRFEESLLTFRKVNDEAQSLMNVAYIHSQRHEPQMATSLYELVLNADPANKAAAKAIQQLKAEQAHALAEVPAPAQESGKDAATSEQPDEPSSVAKSKSETSPAASSNRRWDEEITAVRVQPADPVAGPVISSAEVMPPAVDFERPLITPFGTDAPPTAVAATPTQELKPASMDRPFEAPQPLPTNSEAVETAIADAKPAAAPLPVDETSPPLDQDKGKPQAEDSEELSGLEWARDDLAVQNQASKPETADRSHNEDVLRGYCPVALRDQRRLVLASDEFTAEHQSQTFHFSSAEALERFRENPDWYAPVAGGLDILEVKRGHAPTTGSLDFAVWYRRRLHMFSSEENLAQFCEAPKKFALAQ